MAKYNILQFLTGFSEKRRSFHPHSKLKTSIAVGENIDKKRKILGTIHKDNCVRFKTDTRNCWNIYSSYLKLVILMLFDHALCIFLSFPSLAVFILYHSVPTTCVF